MPEVIVLGIAQDGGVPHAGCLCQACAAARTDSSRRHFPVSLGIVSGSRFAMIDATSAFEEQHFMLWSSTPARLSHTAERFPAPESILITHAHTGHYVGMWQLDRSVLAADQTRVYAPPATTRLLAANEPWVAMQREGFISISELTPGTAMELLPGVTVETVEVVHRSEWNTDTVAVMLSGASRRLLYLPDIDTWAGLGRDLVSFVQEFDVVLLDGCFWQAPPRKGVPHPPITETMDLLQDVADKGAVTIAFTHLNHSNPVLLPGSDELREVQRRGFSVVTEGDRFPL